MEKTSRRKFGKQLTAALAAVPAVSLVASQDVSAQQQPKPRARDEILSSHNTPPDVVITDGSVVVESHDELEDVGGRVYRPKADPTDDPDITHIRVLIDNGDKVYEDLEAKTSTIVIGWQNNGGNHKKALDILTEGGKFTIKSDKDLVKKTVPNKPRKHKLVHSEGENFRIAYVAVTNPAGLTTTFTAPSNFESVEFRVLIWRH